MRMFLRQPIMVVVKAELYWVHMTVLNTFTKSKSRSHCNVYIDWYSGACYGRANKLIWKLMIDNHQKETENTGERELKKENRIWESFKVEALYQLPGLNTEEGGGKNHEEGVVVHDPVLAQLREVELLFELLYFAIDPLFQIEYRHKLFLFVCLCFNSRSVKRMSRE